jgi:4'-phosphopantetheinyl transferase
MHVLGDQRRDAGGSLDAGRRAVAAAVRHAAAEQVCGESLRTWVLGVSAVDTTALVACLDDGEARRAAAYARAEDRARFIAAHGALRALLGEVLDVPPSAVVYRREPCPTCGRRTGRPAVDHPGRPVHFSVATRAEVVVVAVATAPVGVDVEWVPAPGVVAEVSSLLHPAERAELHGTEPARRGVVFARLWARKEAYLKGCGVGVAHGLDGEYLGTEQPALLPSGWRILEVPAPAGYAAAAALRTIGVSRRR